jgi:ketosteroid isomerase-like protein
LDPNARVRKDLAQGTTAANSGARAQPGEVYTLRDGKVSRVDEYIERDHALKAAGLSE